MAPVLHFLLLSSSIMTFSVITLNTGGCVNALRNFSLYRFLSNLTPNHDIILLQETYSLTAQSPCWRNWQNYTPLCSPGPTPGTGVTILFRKNIAPETSTILFPGHLLFLRVKLNGAIANIYNCLVPQANDTALQLFQNLADHSDQQSEGNIFVGGDFNCTLDPSHDRVAAPAEHRPRVSAALQNFVTTTGLCDVWRRVNPDGDEFTWTRKNLFDPTRMSKARLDRFYIPPSLLPSVRSCKILPCSLSDHSAVQQTVSQTILFPSKKQRLLAF